MREAISFLCMWYTSGVTSHSNEGYFLAWLSEEQRAQCRPEHQGMGTQDPNARPCHRRGCLMQYLSRRPALTTSAYRSTDTHPGPPRAA